MTTRTLGVENESRPTVIDVCNIVVTFGTSVVMVVVLVVGVN